MTIFFIFFAILTISTIFLASRLVDDRQFNATLVADLLDEESSTYSVGSVGSIELDESASKSKNKQSERVKGQKKLKKRSSSRRIAANNDHNPKISVNEANNGKSDEDAPDVENIFDTTVVNATTSVEDDNSATSSSEDCNFTLFYCTITLYSPFSQLHSAV